MSACLFVVFCSEGNKDSRQLNGKHFLPFVHNPAQRGLETSECMHIKVRVY